jgi:glutamate decarboxylase
MAAIARKFGVRFHIDASWGGPFVFLHSLTHKLHGTGLADSIAIKAHKMAVVPMACSFLLALDLRQRIVVPH